MVLKLIVVGTDETKRKRARREGQIMELLQIDDADGGAPHLCRCFDSHLFERWGVHCLVLEYGDGGSLEERRKRAGGRLPEREVCEVAKQTLTGAATMHAKGVHHKDLKPDNIVLSGGTAVTYKIIDFGIASAAGAGRRSSTATMQTSQGARQRAVGTPAFMSPEQLDEDEEPDARSDIWSVGVTMHYLLSGELPFGSLAEQSLADLQLRICDDDPAPLTELVAGLAQELADVVLRALEKDPNNRFQTAQEMREALRAAAGDYDVYIACPGAYRCLALGLKQAFGALGYVCFVDCERDDAAGGGLTPEQERDVRAQLERVMTSARHMAVVLPPPAVGSDKSAVDALKACHEEGRTGRLALEMAHGLERWQKEQCEVIPLYVNKEELGAEGFIGAELKKLWGVKVRAVDLGIMTKLNALPLDVGDVGVAQLHDKDARPFIVDEIARNLQGSVAIVDRMMRDKAKQRGRNGGAPTATAPAASFHVPVGAGPGGGGGLELQVVEETLI